MFLVIVKWEEGKLVVDVDSLHHFGADVPEGEKFPQGAYTLEITDIKQLS